MSIPQQGESRKSQYRLTLSGRLAALPLTWMGHLRLQPLYMELRTGYAIPFDPIVRVDKIETHHLRGFTIQYNTICVKIWSIFAKFWGTR